MRYVDEKHPDGASADVKGGVGKALFYLKDIEFEEEDPSDKFGYVKLGESGVNVRNYTKCCGTMMNSAGGAAFPCNFRPFTRNCIIKTDDGTPFKTDAEPLNINASCAFDPSAVPDPKHATAPMGTMSYFISGMLKKAVGIGKNPSLAGKKVFYATGKEDDVEVCPSPEEGK
jgi:hypothetical protein